MSSKFRRGYFNQQQQQQQKQKQQQQQQSEVTSGTVPTVWQIYFDDDEGEEVKVKVDPATIDDPHRDEDDDDEDAEVMTSDIGNDRDQDNRSNTQTHQPLPMKDTEIHIHKTGEPNVSLYSTRTPKDSSSLAMGFGTFENISDSGKRILIRRDSDLELLLPPGSSRVESWKWSSVASWCACSERPTWKRLLWTTTLAVCIAAAYVVAMVAIFKGIGGY